LAIPAGVNIYGINVQQKMRGKVSLEEIKYCGKAQIDIPEDGLYIIESFGCTKVLVDGVDLGADPREKKFELELKKGTKQLSIESGNHGQPFINSMNLKITNKRTKTIISPYNTITDIEQFLSTKNNHTKS
jgi:hypothetical protein